MEGGGVLLPRPHVKKEQCMALKRMAVGRIDANAVSFPRVMLLSRVQPKFKDCAQTGGAGPSLSQRGESP